MSSVRNPRAFTGQSDTGPRSATHVASSAQWLGFARSARAASTTHLSTSTIYPTSTAAMDRFKDVESGAEYKPLPAADPADNEHEGLLASQDSAHQPNQSRCQCRFAFSKHPKVYAAAAFVAGVVSCLAVQAWVCGGQRPDVRPQRQVEVFAPPYAGSSEVHHFPPASPTNVFPSLFPTDVGHAGPTPTGAEPALIATAPIYPVHSGAPHLVSPFMQQANATAKEFDLFKHWGNLAPWFSVGRGAFGLDSGPEVPDKCSIDGLHLVHRHGARYPTQYGPSGII